MSSPKFSVGELVAVCSTDLSVVIPKTVVTRVLLWGGAVYNKYGHFQGTISEQWVYQVADAPSEDFGLEKFFYEKELRPYFDDDYDMEEDNEEVLRWDRCESNTSTCS